MLTNFLLMQERASTGIPGTISSGASCLLIDTIDEYGSTTSATIKVNLILRDICPFPTPLGLKRSSSLPKLDSKGSLSFDVSTNKLNDLKVESSY
mmetsp:Transcript_16786/g.37745  ORF Transcript_16786/g.37745 Transcript_16786/m.37745 type:complete len:95 (+) Transcript_16786:548-832(+)